MLVQRVSVLKDVDLDISVMRGLSVRNVISKHLKQILWQKRVKRCLLRLFPVSLMQRLMLLKPSRK